jgi:hypothetical protein
MVTVHLVCFVLVKMMRLKWMHGGVEKIPLILIPFPLYIAFKGKKKIHVHGLKKIKLKINIY